MKRRMKLSMPLMSLHHILPPWRVSSASTLREMKVQELGLYGQKSQTFHSHRQLAMYEMPSLLFFQ